jgi:hypothetical protein
VEPESTRIDQDTLARLREIATAVRNAIEESRIAFPGYLKDKFAAFPKETCSHASTLLALYLSEQGFLDVQFVFNGCRHDDFQRSHAWLEIGPVIIDITADQFDGISDPVIVTLDRTFHDQFYGQHRQRAVQHFAEHTAPAKKNYTKAYIEIKKLLEEK